MKNVINIDQKLIDSIILQMINNKQTLSIAESCTGGFLSSCFTSKKGASNYFVGSVVAYSNHIKESILDVNKIDILDFGVVSQPVVELMAKNIRKKYKTDFGLATTGYVDIFYDGVNHHSDLYAWIAISSDSFLKSEYISLEKSRLENISVVSETILKMFRKHI